MLIIEVVVGIVLAVFLLKAIFAMSNRPSRSPVLNEPESTVWLIFIGDQTECVLAKEKEAGYCCQDKVYNPAFANTVHQFSTLEEARAWTKEMVNVQLDEAWGGTPATTTYWHGNLEVKEVTPAAAAGWLEHRTADGKVDPVYLAECAARAKAAEERLAAEEAAHLARMQERLSRGQNQKT